MVMLLWQTQPCIFVQKYTGEAKIKENVILFATLSRTMRSVKLSRNVSYRSKRIVFEQGKLKAVPSKSQTPLRYPASEPARELVR